LSPTDAAEVEVSVRGTSFSDVEAVFLSTPDIHDHNTFDEPEKVKLGDSQSVSAENGVVRITLPAGSIVRLMGSI